MRAVTLWAFIQADGDRAHQVRCEAQAQATQEREVAAVLRRDVERVSEFAARPKGRRLGHAQAGRTHRQAGRRPDAGGAAGVQGPGRRRGA